MIDFQDSEWHRHFDLWFKEDVGSGDHSSLASIVHGTQASSRLLLKEDGVLAGLEFSR